MTLDQVLRRAYADGFEHGLAKAALDISEYEAMYDTFDKGHDRSHADAVTGKARMLAEKYAPGQVDLAVLAAKLHDIGLSKGRDRHESYGAEMVLGDPRLSADLGGRKLKILANAIRQHRASTGRPRSIVARIVSDADRMAASDAASAVRRAYDFGLDHEPSLTDDEQVSRALRHIAEKYGPGGSGRRFYFPETDEHVGKWHEAVDRLHRNNDLVGARELLGLKSE